MYIFLQAIVYCFQYSFLGFVLFDVLVDMVFDEDFFQVGEVQFFQQFCFMDFQFLFKEGFGLLCVNIQDVFYGCEVGFVFNDYIGIWRNGYFVVGKGIKCINGEVRGNVVFKFYQYFDVFGGIVYYFFDFDFVFVVGFKDVVNKGLCSCGVRQFLNSEGIFIYCFDFGFDFNLAVLFVVFVV